MAYDPCWHPEVRAFADELARPGTQAAVRTYVESVCGDYLANQVTPMRFEEIARTYERLEVASESTRDPPHPLQIDRNLVEMQAMLPHLSENARGWMRSVIDRIAAVAERTFPLRAALCRSPSREQPHA